MEETRVERYKEYRQSFIKEGSISSTENINLTATTSTLPMGEVINTVQTKEKEKISFGKRKMIKIIAFSLLGALIIAGLIVLGIFAWGN